MRERVGKIGVWMTVGDNLFHRFRPTVVRGGEVADGCLKMVVRRIDRAEQNLVFQNHLLHQRARLHRHGSVARGDAREQINAVHAERVDEVKFELRDARCQLGCYSHPMVEMAVAAAVSPSGPTAAGKHGLGLLSMAATSDQGFDVLPAHWAVCEDVAAEHAQSVDRKNWRLVVPMHLAETREKARADMGHGLLKLVRYFEKLGGEDLASIRTLDAAVEQWTERGLTLLGRAIIGTPDDAITRLRALEQQSGGYGAVLLLAHDCASPKSSLESYELFARHVLPALRDENRGRVESLEWFHKHSKKIVGDLKVAIGSVIEEHEAERQKRGRGVAWGDARDLLVGDDPKKR